MADISDRSRLEPVGTVIREYYQPRLVRRIDEGPSFFGCIVLTAT